MTLMIGIMICTSLDISYIQGYVIVEVEEKRLSGQTVHAAQLG